MNNYNMCSFNIIKLLNSSIEDINYYTQKRGPDCTNIVKVNNITFVHNLLHITGVKVYQPFQKNNIACVFNGEIYNYDSFGDYQTDGQCLIDLYLKHGTSFTNLLDGEFALALIDFDKRLIVMSTDIFSTKPLFYSFEDDNFMISSYGSSIKSNKMKNIKKLEANKTVVYDLDNLEQIDEHNVYNFDLKQYKTSFNDWDVAFENALRKRTRNLQRNLFVSLSSGYDSGAICCGLNNLDVKYKTFTVMGKEDPNVIRKRLNLNKMPKREYRMDENVISRYKSRNDKMCCDYSQKVLKNNDKVYSVLKDRASCGGSFIYDEAKRENYIVSLSGQGADEIFADYGHNGRKLTWHSCFGGKFPDDLNSIFPWESFFSGIGQCLLMKEEIIGGSYGLEQRYPFLDKMVVQEFLWLTPELKNKHYKSVLYNYMTAHNYPFALNKKVGFNCLY